MNPEISCSIQYIHVLTTLCVGNESGMCLQNSSVPVDGIKTSITVEIAGLCAREKYCYDFSILDQSGAIVDTVNTQSFSKLTK